jgi:hypothetical protein
MCRDHRLPLRVMNLNESGALVRIMRAAKTSVHW